MAKKKKDEIEFLDGENGRDFMWRRIAELVKPKEPDPEQVALEAAREKCRKGNPFPLVAMQWPDTILTDPEEIEIFQRSRSEERLAGMTDSVVRACLDPDNPPLRLDYWQHIALAAFFDDSVAEIAEKGATKVGKGASTSIGINLWFDVWPECKIILTSQRFKHAQDVIFGETLKWYGRMKHRRGRPTGFEIKDTSTHYITIANPDSGEGFSGQHGPRTLFVFDEASSIPDGFYDDSAKQARKVLALANPRVLSGWFRGMYKPCKDENRTQMVNGPFGKRLCMTIDGAEVINVAEKRLEKPLGPPGGIEIDGKFYAHNDIVPQEDFRKVCPLIPEQCDYGRHMGIRQHPDPNHVAVMAHGHFPKEDAQRQVILGSWLDRHTAYWKENQNSITVDSFGLDIAASKDGDSSCLAVGGSKGCREIHKWQYADTTMSVGKVFEIARQYGVTLSEQKCPVCVDMDGLGKGVGDQLRALGAWVIEFRGNKGSDFDPKTYGNLRAEAYSLLGRRLNPDDQWKDEPWGLPYDAELFEELCAPEKVFSATDALRFHLSPKRPSAGHESSKVVSVKEKIGRSPDTADAVVYLYHAARIKHNLDGWLRSIQNRPLICFPSTPEETREIVKAVEEAPPPKTEWDDIAWDWQAPKEDAGERTITVSKPDKNPRRPWWERYAKDD